MSSSSGSELFARLHRRGQPLLLANAWDVASAVAIAAARAPAIATTSAGVAWSLGVADAAGLGAERVAEVTARIVAAVDVPVSDRGGPVRRGPTAVDQRAHRRVPGRIAFGSD